DRRRGQSLGGPAGDARSDERWPRVIELVQHADLVEDLPQRDEEDDHPGLDRADEPGPARERERGERDAHEASRLRSYERVTSSRRSPHARSYSDTNSGANRTSLTLRGRGMVTG